MIAFGKRHSEAIAARARKQAGVLLQLWFNRGSVTEGQASLQQILELPATMCNPAVRRAALPMLANLATRHADYAVALGAFEELLAEQRSTSDHLGAVTHSPTLRTCITFRVRIRRHGRVSMRVEPKPASATTGIS